jgi:thiol-disulfide isomerase/thioredoxin
MSSKQWIKDGSRQRAKQRGQKRAGGSSPTTLVLAAITAAVIVGIAIFAIFQTMGSEGESFTPNSQGLLPAGSEAPDFTAATVNDRGEFSLGDTGGSGATMLVFFATWCPHCQNEAPVIADLKADYGDDLRVVMVGIDNVQGDTPEAVRDFVEEYGIDAPAVYQPELGPTYQISGYPTTYVLDGDNQIVAAHSGEAPESAFRSWIDEALG